MIHATSGHCECCPEYRPPQARIKTISTTWPWDHRLLDPAQAVERLVDLGTDEVCIRTPAYYVSYKPAYHAELVARAMDAGIAVSIWPVISLYWPEKQADAIKRDVELYNPDRVFLDAERSWVTNYSANLPRFLNSLGKVGVPVGLGSYRRATLHQNMRWQVWLQHKTGSVYTIDFLAHQLYPIGWNAPAVYADQTRLDVLSHEAEVQKAGRPPMPWFPWMPAFSEHGWTPSASGVKAQVDALHALLGDRLVGVNVWSLDQDMVKPGLEPVYLYVKNLWRS